MANRYWVGNSGNWSDTAHWSATSGGSSGASVPSSSDDVFFDSASGTGAVTVNVTANCKDITFTGSTINTVNHNATLNVYGSFTLKAGMAWNPTGYSLIFRSTTTGKTVNTNGVKIDYVYFTGAGGAWTLLSNLSIGTGSSWGVLNVTSGTLNTNGYSVTSSYFILQGAASGVVLGTSTINVANWNANLASALSAASSTINLSYIYDDTTPTFYGSNSTSTQTYGNLTVTGNATINDSNIFNTLTLSPGYTYTFANGRTQTVNDFVAAGTVGNIITLRSSTTGGGFTLSKASGTVRGSFLDIKDSTATGGATWWATDSTDSGNNTGWKFGRIYTLSASHTSTGQSIALASETNIAQAITVGTGGGRAIVNTVYQSLPQKEYEHRVFTHDGDFVAIWDNVTSDFGYTQLLNQNASELLVKLGRSPENRAVTFTTLLDESSGTITDEDGSPILVQTSTANAVGPDTDVELNYNVDVYAFYGGYDQLLDENSNAIMDDTGEPILSQFGAPNGIRVYSGYIADYSLSYGGKVGVDVVVVPHATEQNHYIFKNGANTTVEYNSVDPVQMARDAMTNYNLQGGVVGYTNESMPLSGEVASYDFKLQTIRESVDKTVDLLPSGYYQFVDPGENLQYLLSKSATADHTFWYEQHVTDLNLRKSLTQLVNEAYLVGGDTGAGTLFRYQEDAPSKAAYRPGLYREADSRVTLTDSADIILSTKIAELKTPRYRTTVIISDATYDIETIKLGEMVGFKNFGTFVDELLLQIVGLERTPHTIKLDLDMVIDSDTKRLEDIKRRLMSKEVEAIPDLPS